MHERGRRFLYYVGILAGDCMVFVMFFMLSIQPAAATIPLRVDYEDKTKKVIAAIQGEPVYLSINKLQLSWPVIAGAFDPQTDNWTESGDKVVFAEGSLPANDSNGTTLLYGHARASVFINLPRLESGDIATVQTSNGYLFTYKFESAKEVVPTDTSLFTIAGAPKLVLQTCTGPWDSYRGLYDFKFEKVEKT